MPSWRSSAAYRIAFANFGAYAFGLALLGIVVFAVMHAAFTRQLDGMVSDETQVLSEQYASDGVGELGEAIRQREQSSSSTRMLYALFAPDGRRIMGTLRTRRPEVGLRSIAFTDPGEGQDSARARVVDLSPRERLVVAVDSEWLERIERTIIIIFGGAFAGACLVGFGGAIVLGEYLRGRLRSISESAEAIIGGDTRQRMPVSARADEFDELAATLNRMLDRVEGLLENLRQVSSDVAHDLRTPLSRLRGRLERGAIQQGNEAVVIEEAIAQVDHVLALFAAILRIAEVESGETRRYFEPVAISALGTELAESFAPSIEDDGRSLSWSIEPDLTVSGDRELLAQAIINLIENAQRHTPVGTSIRLTVERAQNRVLVRVADNGPGVPQSDLERVTRRFARLEGSRNTAGHGLGLSLVSAVAKLHGGQLILTPTQPGLSAAVDLPATPVANSTPNKESGE